jgi:hypothetical protein
MTWLPPKPPPRPPPQQQQQQLAVQQHGPIPKLEKAKGKKRPPGAPAVFSSDPPFDVMGDAYVAECSACS